MNNLMGQITKNLTILVIGDIMVDLFSFCGSNKKSAEVDIPVAVVEKQELRLGGASNVWNNLAGLNTNALLCGSVGNDKYGKFVRKQITHLDFLAKSKKTTVKHRYYLNNRQVFRVDNDFICHHNKKTYNNLLNKIKNIKLDAIIISDYLKGFCDNYFIENIIKYANKNNIFVAVDSKFNDISKFSGANLIKINNYEFKVLFNRAFNFENLEEIKHILLKNKINKLLITLGKDGMVLIDNVNVIKTESNIVKNADVIGAGDCVVSCYTVAKLNALTEKECLKFASLCAEYCVSKIGTKSFNITEYKKEFYE